MTRLFSARRCPNLPNASIPVFPRPGAGGERGDALADLRSNFGRSILLGLEFLIAADIINTVAVTPTLQSVIVLGAIVLIRTFLSFSLELEIDGRWPWQRRAGEKRKN